MMTFDKTTALAYIDPIRLNMPSTLHEIVIVTNTVIQHFLDDAEAAQIACDNLKTAVLIDALCNIIYDTFDYASYNLLELAHEIQLMPINYTDPEPQLQMMLADALLHYAMQGDPENMLNDWIAICYAQIVDNIDCHIYNL